MHMAFYLIEGILRNFWELHIQDLVQSYKEAEKKEVDKLRSKMRKLLQLLKLEEMT